MKTIKLRGSIIIAAEVSGAFRDGQVVTILFKRSESHIAISFDSELDAESAMLYVQKVLENQFDYDHDD